MQTIEATSAARISANGAYRVRFLDAGGKRHFSAEWAGPASMTPTGTVILSFEGDHGDPPGVLDLAAARVCASTVKIPFVDLNVSGLPAGGEIIVHFN